MKESGLKERVLKNSFWSFGSAIVSRFGALIFTVILARILMPENYGLYSIVLSTAMIFYTFVDLGINQTLARYIAFALEKQKASLSAYYRYLLKIKFILTLVASILLFVLAYPLSYYVFRNSNLFLPLLVAAAYIFVLSFDSFYTQIFFSLEKLKYYNIKEFINQTLRIGSLLIIFGFIPLVYRVVGVFGMFALISLILIIYSLYYTKKLMPEIYEKPRTTINKSKINKFIGFLTIASISAILFSQGDAVLLGIFLKPEYVGYYKAALALALGVVGLLSSFNLVFLPVFTKLKKKKIEHSLNTIIKYLSILTVPAVFGLFILGKYFIRAFYGYNYMAAALPFYFVVFIIFPAVFVNLFLTVFSAEEKPQKFTKAIIITTILNISLNIILIKLFLNVSEQWATAGAGIAALASWAAYFFITLNIIRSDLKIKVSFIHAVKPLIASIIMAISLYYLIHFLGDINVIKGFALVFLGMIIYFLLLLIIGGVNKEDLNLLKLAIKR